MPFEFVQEEFFPLIWAWHPVDPVPTITTEQIVPWNQSGLWPALANATVNFSQTFQGATVDFGIDSIDHTVHSYLLYHLQAYQITGQEIHFTQADQPSVGDKMPWYT